MQTVLINLTDEEEKVTNRIFLKIYLYGRMEVIVLLPAHGDIKYAASCFLSTTDELQVLEFYCVPKLLTQYWISFCHHMWYLSDFLACLLKPESGYGGRSRLFLHAVLPPSCIFCSS